MCKTSVPSKVFKDYTPTTHSQSYRFKVCSLVWLVGLSVALWEEYNPAFLYFTYFSFTDRHFSFVFDGSIYTPFVMSQNKKVLIGLFKDSAQMERKNRHVSMNLYVLCGPS